MGKGSATVGPIRSIKEIRAIKGLLAHEPRDFALFVFGIHAGLRGHDLLGLRWRELTDAKGMIALKVEIIESKTGKRRTLSVQENARQALTWWLSASKAQPNDLVFPNPKGRRLSIQRLHQLVNQWTAEAGISGHFGSHTLRKTYGYHLRQAGVGIEVLMKVFGHSSQSTTLRYIGIEQEEIDEANLRLNL